MPVMEPQAFVDDLRARGFEFYSGVPCSLLKGLLSHLDQREDLRYLPATREDSALAVAAGATMAGERAVVLMQNSGLGVSINVLISLQHVYRIPTLLVISWRGYEGVDAPEHIIMGPAMPALLDLFEIPHKTLEPDAIDFAAELEWADRTLQETQRPVALLVRKGAL
jgi:sulfopyruvate decarboxylase subunit alpha